ncbi:MAG: GNAT family N-acetyltransferase [Desulfosarcinaceae bacterium]|nr:GNAT family N-acetyltransferase [Desulfosarcinaceae bacterium]
MGYDFSYRPYAEALYLALREDVFYVIMEASVTKGTPREAMIRYMDYAMVEAENLGALHLSQASGGGASVWTKPLDAALTARQHREKIAFLREHLGRKSAATYGAIVDYMAAKAQPHIPADTWYLSILGIRPAYQGQGLGAALVHETLTRTDALGIPTYAETFAARSLPFYHRLGYRTVARFVEPVSTAPYWLLLRSGGRAT